MQRKEKGREVEGTEGELSSPHFCSLQRNLVYKLSSLGELVPTSLKAKLPSFLFSPLLTGVWGGDGGGRCLGLGIQQGRTMIRRQILHCEI